VLGVPSSLEYCAMTGSTETVRFGTLSVPAAWTSDPKISSTETSTMTISSDSLSPGSGMLHQVHDALLRAISGTELSRVRTELRLLPPRAYQPKAARGERADLVKQSNDAVGATGAIRRFLSKSGTSGSTAWFEVGLGRPSERPGPRNQATVSRTLWPQASVAFRLAASVLNRPPWTPPFPR
jgi:hypothetical protein